MRTWQQVDKIKPEGIANLAKRSNLIIQIIITTISRKTIRSHRVRHKVTVVNSEGFVTAWLCYLGELNLSLSQFSHLQNRNYNSFYHACLFDIENDDLYEKKKSTKHIYYLLLNVK